MTNSKLIIDTLKQSAVALENQNQKAAIDTLAKISTEVATVQKEAEALEKSSAISQKENVKKVNELIKQQAVAYADHTKTKKELDMVYSEIASKKVSIADLNNRIADRNIELQGSYNKLRANQRRIADLNNKSAGSIFVSIFTLGLDRAVKAISIEIDGVNDQISNSKKTIARFNQNLTDLQNEIRNDKVAVAELKKREQEKINKIKELEYEEFKFHNQEKQQRVKVVFFTEINLFYIKIQNVLKNVSNRITDVADIVSVLDNETPTIASFDPSMHELLTLKQAILLFGDQLENNRSMETTIPTFDENRWYAFTTEWLGKGKSLDIVNDGKNNQLIMNKTGGVSGQQWKIKSLGNGYFRLTCMWLKENKSLDIVNDGTNNQLFMGDTGNYSGQFWKIEHEFGFYRLTTKWLGERKSLDILNDGVNNKLIMADSGDYAGQHWRITLV